MTKQQIEKILIDNAEEPEDFSIGNFKTYRVEYLVNDLLALLSQAEQAERERIITEIYSIATDNEYYDPAKVAAYVYMLYMKIQSEQEESK